MLLSTLIISFVFLSLVSREREDAQVRRESASTDGRSNAQRGEREAENFLQ